MGRTLKFSVRKNSDRKKYFKLNVSVPLEMLKPFLVSLPLHSYTQASASSGEKLYARLCRHPLPTHWSLATVDTPMSSTVHTTMDIPSCSIYTAKCRRPPFAAEVTFTVTIYSDLTWRLILGSLPVPHSHIPAAPTRLLSVPEVLTLLTTLDSVRLCIASPEDKYLTLLEERGPLMDKTGEVDKILLKI